MLISRNPQGKGGPHARSTLQLDVTAVIDCNTLDDRQSQSGPTGGTAESLINTEETFEYLVLVFGFNPPALIRNRDLYETVRQPCAD